MIKQVLRYNTAYVADGAISLISWQLWKLFNECIDCGIKGGIQLGECCNSTKLIIHGNKAQRGSAFYFRSLISSNNHNYNMLHHIELYYNHATIGGTIYWIYDDTMKYAPIIDKNTIIFINNIALYGREIATQTVRTTCPSSYNVLVYENSFTINFTLLDFIINIYESTN